MASNIERNYSKQFIDMFTCYIVYRYSLKNMVDINFIYASRCLKQKKGSD